MTEEGLTHPVIARLADALTARAAARREILRHASSCQHVLRIAFSLAHGADWASHIPQPLLNDLPRYNCVLFHAPSPRAYLALAFFCSSIRSVKMPLLTVSMLGLTEPSCTFNVE